MEEFTHNLLDLWDEYRSSNTRTFQPTMTDFMEYLRNKYASQETERSVNEGANSHFGTRPSSEASDPARWALSEPIKGYRPKLRDDAKQPLGTPLTKDKVKEVRRLYEKGLSLPRIRQQLELNISLTRMQTIVNKPW